MNKVLQRKVLQEKRLEKKLTQKQLAQILGITERFYQHLEAGTRKGSLEIWDKLEEELETSQKDLRVQKMPGCSQAKEKGLKN